jgi:FtsP/CotA-like multicopper oxidase with cupredoxin domain
MTFRFLLLIGLSCIHCFANASNLTLYINKGSLTIGTSFISACAFNADENLNTKSEIIELDVNEVINITVINTDSLEHSFTIDGFIDSNNAIAPFQTEVFYVSFPNPGTFRYYSDKSYGANIGASGIFLIGFPNESHFFWNLFDLNKQLTHDFANLSETSYPADYLPELFFISGTHYPFTLEDPQTKVVINNGQSCIISVVNSGYMDHVLHFHGFHVEILSAQLAADRVGWSKDTIPLKKGEAMTFRLVANQVGIYPVHDHNLIAVTNAGFYPGGMLTQIQVLP